MKIGLYPGVFDPVTYGHLDIIKRGLLLFDKLIVAVSQYSKKDIMFDIDLRCRMLEVACKENGFLEKVVIKPFSGLLADFAVESQVSFLIRGIRTMADFEYEYSMNQVNKMIAGVDTVYLLSSENVRSVSSSFVKELYRLGGSDTLEKFVPGVVIDLLDIRSDKNTT